MRTTSGAGPLPRGRHELPRKEVVRSQRERLLTAAAKVCAERGYDGTTVATILAEAGVGRETFYELFEDRRDCVLESHQVLLDGLIERVRVVYSGPGEWVVRCRATIAALLDWFAADPLIGRFLLVELAAVGPEFHERFEAGFDRFVAVIDSGLDPELAEPQLLPTSSLAVGAAISRVYGEVAAGRAEHLSTLAPSLTYEILVPFLGEDAARAAAFAKVPRAG
jgi:AcrR family transcriptional regulator